MNFRIPFVSPHLEIAKKRAKPFISLVRRKKKSSLEDYLRSAGVNLSREEYISICLRSFVIIFIFLYVFSTVIMGFFAIPRFYLWGFAVSLAFSAFSIFSQLSYPRIYVVRKQRNIEKNLIAALQDLLIQITSGIPLFSAMTNLSDADYDELSREFEKAVRRINAGEPEEDVLEDIGRKNHSVFFRRTLWQISNGMRSGSDLEIIIRDSIKALGEEQVIQVQNYGNKLNPLIMFYMLISVIIPSLSITFMTVLSSMVNLPNNNTVLLFCGLFVVVVFAQIMFIGLIKSKRPSLL